MIDSVPKFLNGAYSFTGAGYDAGALLAPALVYTVPADKRAQLIYLRAGNSCGELVSVTFMQDGKVARIFPIGARMSVHVPLAVVEDLMPDTKIEIFFAAPAAVSGTLIIDIGIVEI